MSRTQEQGNVEDQGKEHSARVNLEDGPLEKRPDGLQAPLHASGAARYSLLLKESRDLCRWRFLAWISLES